MYQGQSTILIRKLRTAVAATSTSGIVGGCCRCHVRQSSAHTTDVESCDVDVGLGSSVLCGSGLHTYVWVPDATG